MTSTPTPRWPFHAADYPIDRGNPATRRPGSSVYERMAAPESPETTIRRIRLFRAITLWGLRLIGLAVLVRGIYLCVNRAVFGLSQGQISLGWNTFRGVGEGHLLAAGITASMIGLAMLLLARPLSRFVIAMPDRGCPACGHTGEVNKEGRCLECGWRVESSKSSGADST